MVKRERDFAALILAAGFSSRANGFKPLLPLGSGTIIGRVISSYLQNGVEVFVVVGHRQDEIKESIGNLCIHIVENPDYRLGMFTSIQVGVRKLGGAYGWFFVSPVDIALISPDTIARLMAEAKNNLGKILFPVFNGRRGHPPVIPSSLIPAILGWDKDGGLNAVLSQNKELALEVQVTDSNILFDVDTPEDYQELLRRYGRLHPESE
jgi:molybdenum cofactor cytidylyltransferase